MKPKRAALVGLVFVVIAFFYLAAQVVAGVPVDFAGLHDAPGPGRRDVAHGLRPVRRAAAELRLRR